MILRLSAKICRKIREGTLSALPRDPNPYSDWSCHVFTCERAQYVIVTNTTTLYSALMHGRGITSADALIKRAFSSVRDVMEGDGLEFQYLKCVVPTMGSFRFAKALDRVVTGSINDLIRLARAYLEERELSPYDTSARINDAPMTALNYDDPREAMRKLWADVPSPESSGQN